MKTRLAILFFLFIGCGKDPIPDPSPAILISPENGNNCTTATSISVDQSQVVFSWSKAANTDYYQLIATNKNTNSKFSDTTKTFTKKLTLQKGFAYSWKIVSISNATAVTTDSETWEFYIEGNIDGDYLPQPAILVSPANEEIISLSNSNLVSFSWLSNDQDNNISGYDFYIGTSLDNLVKTGDKISQNTFSQELQENNTYYWQVITFDQQDNSASSGVNQFQTIP